MQVYLSHTLSIIELSLAESSSAYRSLETYLYTIAPEHTISRTSLLLRLIFRDNDGFLRHQRRAYIHGSTFEDSRQDEKIRGLLLSP